LIDKFKKDERSAELEAARARNADKRAEMEKKYPDLAKYNK
jgi:hypothetical protein